MKKYTFIIALFFAMNIVSQKLENKLFVNFSYGLSFIDYDRNPGIVDFEFPTTGSFIDISVDFKVSKNKYLGLGFSRLQHAKSLNDSRSVQTNTFLILDNFRNIHQKDYIDVHFKTVFSNNVNFNLGLFYFFDYFNGTELNTVSTDTENIRLVVLSNELNRSDNFGLFLATGYFFKLNDYVHFGANAKLYYSLNGLETFAILPTLKVGF